MITTIIGKYIVGAPTCIKNQIVCNMHMLLDDMSIIKSLLSPSLINKYNLLHFDDIAPEFESSFKKLHLILIVIEHKSGTEIHISQGDVLDLYYKVKLVTMCGLDYYQKRIGAYFVCEMHRTLNNNITKSFDKLKLLCDGCSCVNILEFNDTILKEEFKLHVRHDLAYKFISNIDFQICYDVIDTIKIGINDIKNELTNTCNKFVIIILSMTDVNSSISLLHKDIIGALVYHLIHNINDEWMMHKIRYALPSK